MWKPSENAEGGITPANLALLKFVSAIEVSRQNSI
jgi:hypothetical protein